LLRKTVNYHHTIHEPFTYLEIFLILGVNIAFARETKDFLLLLSYAIATPSGAFLSAAVFLMIYLVPCNTMFVASFLLPCSQEGVMPEFKDDRTQFWITECAKITYAVMEGFFMFQCTTATVFSNLIITWQAMVVLGKLLINESR